MPYEYMVPYVTAVPSVVRPLKQIQKKKEAGYLDLASILLKRFPHNDTNGRAIAFLIDLVTNHDTGPLPDLPWFTQGSTMSLIKVDPPTLLGKLAPGVRFSAVIR